MATPTHNIPAPVCPPPMKATSNGSFQGESPLDFALPLLILQICVVVSFTRILAFLLKPLKQPRTIAEIIGGLLLGPSAFGRIKPFKNTVFPAKSMTVLDTIANLGLVFFLFLVGLELDFSAILRTGKKTIWIALAGISLPFIIGVGTSYILRATVNQGVDQLAFIVFMGVALSITAFPVLARILAELKLLTTDVGRTAMSAAAINDVAAWILLALAIALSGTGTQTSKLVPVWVLLCGVGFVVFCYYVIRPMLVYMARRSPAGEPVKELYICVTLSVVLAMSFVTDTIGIHALFGAFVIGIIMPKDSPFAGLLVEKIEDLISSIFLPLYFAASGLKTDVTTIHGAKSWGLLVIVIFNACFGKIVGTLTSSLMCKVPFREALTLGILMNTKGLVELIVLNIGKDRKVLSEQAFAILVLMALFTTFMTTPIVMAIYKPARKGASYKHRTIQREDLDSELRVLACFHSTRNIPTLINLIESCRGSQKRGKLCVYAMHMMELSERSSAISMVHKARNNGVPFWNKNHGSTNDQMVIVFEAYQQLRSVTVRPMTAISDLNSIHEDIITSAHEKRVAMILVPFHKQQRVDGSMECFGNSFHLVNQRVLQYAPCSVGILVDRGLAGTTQVAASELSYTAVALFFGGRDDREALFYGLRLAEHPGITLVVLRFKFQCGEIEEQEEDNILLSSLNKYVSRVEDEDLTYEEVNVRSAEEVISKLKSMSNVKLFLVGRMSKSSMLSLSSDCPELGPVGSYLASSEFSTTASVLVIQQYDPLADSHPPVLEQLDNVDIVRDKPSTSLV